jgi:hypothetical protein
MSHLKIKRSDARDVAVWQDPAVTALKENDGKKRRMIYGSHHPKIESLMIVGESKRGGREIPGGGRNSSPEIETICRTIS